MRTLPKRPKRRVICRAISLYKNSLRGNYSASFAVFTAKNILGWSDGKDEPKQPPRPLVVRWEKE